MVLLSDIQNVMRDERSKLLEQGHDRKTADIMMLKCVVYIMDDSEPYQ